MNNAELESIATAAEHLAINPVQGKYHKPVALVWAIDRAIRGLPRLVAAAAVRAELDPLLEELTGVQSNASWPWLKLANDLGSAWAVDRADPSADPPADFVAGWSRSTYVAINTNPTEARQLIAAVFARYLNDVRDTVTGGLV